MSAKSRHQVFHVYQDRRDGTNVLVARGDEVITGAFDQVAGPFDSREEAERAAQARLEAALTRRP